LRGSTARQITMEPDAGPTDPRRPPHPSRQADRGGCAGRSEPSLPRHVRAEGGRPSFPPEHLLKASLLMALGSMRGERLFCERLQYDLLFKWVLDLKVEDPQGGDRSASSHIPRDSSLQCLILLEST
jgi:Transposase domain (DUF772)